jgi:acetyl-CoA C-acetyltransferase
VSSRPEAVIVSTARTPIGKAYRGAYRDTAPQQLAGHAIASAVGRAGIDPEEIDDVVLGNAMPEGATGFNVARQSALRAGLPTSVPGMTVDRQCSSGLMAVSIAAKQIVVDGMTAVVGGGVESISLVQTEHVNTYRARDEWFEQHRPGMYLPMLHTAEIVAERYGISRERQDAFAFQSQQRTAKAQQNGLFADEIVALAAIPGLTADGKPPVDNRRIPGGAQAGPRIRGGEQPPLRHRRQLLAAVRRRGRARGHRPELRRGPRPAGPRPLPRHRRRRM